MNAERPHVAALNADLFSFIFTLKDKHCPPAVSFCFHVTLLDHKTKFPGLDLIIILSQHPSVASESA